MLRSSEGRRGARLLRSLGGGLSSNYWKLWGSTATANLADGVISVVLPLIAIRLSSSPAEVAAVSAAGIAPSLLFGLLAGGLADRLDRRWTMLAVQLLRVGILGALTLLAVADALSMAALYVAAFAFGTGEAFFDTNAQSIVPDLVRRERLVAANGRLYAAEMMMNSFVGPPIGGVLIAISVPLALSGTVAGYALGAVGLLLIRGGFRPARTGPARPLHVEILEGLGYLVRHRLLLTLTTMVAMGRLGATAFFAVFALYAVAPGPMGLSEPQFGVLLVMFGVGSLLGSLIAARAVEILGRARILGLAQLIFGLSIGVPAVSADPVAVGGAFFLAGVAVMTWNITNVSLRQSIVPSRLLGRVHASHRFVANVAGLLGALTAGAVGEAIGLPAVFAIGAGIVVASVLGRLIVTERYIAEAEALERVGAEG